MAYCEMRMRPPARTVTTQEIADSLGVAVGVVRAAAMKLYPRQEMTFSLDDKSFVFTGEQADEIKARVTEDNPGEFMTLREVAKELSLSLRTVQQVVSEKGYETNFAPFKTNGGVQKFAVISKARAVAVKTELQNRSKVARNGFDTLTVSNDYEGALLVQRAMSYLTDKVKEMQPKADYYDKICDSTNLYEIGTVGKDIGIGAVKFFTVLANDKIIRKRLVDGVDFYEPYYDYERYFRAVPVPFVKDGKQCTRNKLMFNADGVVWANRRYKMAVVA